MKNLFLKIIKLFKKYTSGFPLVLWSIGGLSVTVFLFVFRHRENMDFGKLIYVIIVSALWIIFSYIAKKKELIGRRVHFIIDSAAYLSFYSLIVYFSGGYEGGLFFLFFLATISAPLFGTVGELIIFLIILSILTHALHYFIDIKTGERIGAYHNGVLLLQTVLYFVIAGVNKYFLEKVREGEKKRRIMAEEAAKKCEEDVRIRTKELNEAVKDLKKSEENLLVTNRQLVDINKQFSFTQEKLKYKVEEMERFNSLAIGRELKMMELKKEIEGLKSRKNAE
ncbi:hypothetical protein HY798_03195 [Candidatus Falkowbacteria bacterium]|nr:hypothetical protein [Candidatus Falkowbacteria bacterium]